MLAAKRSRKMSECLQRFRRWSTPRLIHIFLFNRRRHLSARASTGLSWNLKRDTVIGLFRESREILRAKRFCDWSLAAKVAPKVYIFSCWPRKSDPCACRTCPVFPFHTLFVPMFLFFLLCSVPQFKSTFRLPSLYQEKERLSTILLLSCTARFYHVVYGFIPFSFKNLIFLSSR